MDTTRESRLLLICALPVPAASHLDEAAQIIRRGIDWRSFYRLSQANRIFPESFERISEVLRRDPGIAVDPAWMNAMASAYRQAVASNMILGAEASSVIKALSKQGVAFTPFKGILLERLVYPKNVTRDFSDIDLLLPGGSERAKAKAVLETMGYKKLPSGSDAYHIKMIKRKFNIEVSVELHRNLPGITHLYPYPIISNFWGSLQDSDLGETKLKVMPRELMLLVVALNAYRDGEVKLKDISDIAAIINSAQEFDWGLIQHYRSELAWSYILGPPLQTYAMLMHRLGVPIPDHFPYSLHRSTVISDNKPTSTPSPKLPLIFPLPLSSICGPKGCRGEQCMSCPLLVPRELPSAPEMQTINDAFRYFPIMVRLSTVLLVTCVRIDYGTRYALSCFAMMMSYLKNVYSYMLKLPLTSRRERHN